MLHTRVLRELLDEDVASARDRLGARTQDISVIDAAITCHFQLPSSGGSVYLRFDGRAYDAEPFRLSVVDAEGQPLHAAGWPRGIYHSEHPILKVPFACVQGTYEYHTHPQHVTDIWDRYRNRLRLADLLDHLLRKCGC